MQQMLVFIIPMIIRLVQEMKRYFDMGVFHASEPWIRQELGGAEGEGLKFVVSEV